MAIKSPLTSTTNIRLTRKLASKQLIDLWQQSYAIDITQELKTEDFVYEYQCCDTGLYFFYPFSLTGSANVYEQLQKFDWYYIPEKWEHRQVIKLVKSGMRVLEIGCGEGSFLAKCNKNGAEAVGLELNDAAVEVGRRNGLQITNEFLEEFSEKNSGQFDIVCCFQVLEHVPEPKQFIAHCLKVTKTNGLIVFGVPNAESFFGREFSILDLPPHHMSRWSKSALSSLTSIYQISLQSIKNEPLASYHIKWMLYLLGKKKNLLGILFRLKFVKKIAEMLLQFGGRKLIDGHTILAVFKKT